VTDFDNYKLSLEGRPVLKVSVVHRASPQQRLNWLLEMAALWAFCEKLDLEEAVELFRAEYEQVSMNDVEQRRRGLRIVSNQG